MEKEFPKEAFNKLVYVKNKLKINDLTIEDLQKQISQIHNLTTCSIERNQKISRYEDLINSTYY